MGGLIKDVAVATWFALAAVGITGIVVTVYSDEYCQAYEKSAAGTQNQNTAYYTSQFTRALGALTAGLCFLYVAWIFADSRHPAKSGMWSFSTQRLQQSRLQAKRQHLVKLAVFEAVVLLAWVPPAFILAFEGWLYRGRDNAHQALQGSVCTQANTSNCEELKSAGISTIVETMLLLLVFILTIVPLIVKPKVPILTEPQMREKIKKDDEAKAEKEKKAAREAENNIRRKLHLPEIAEDGHDPLAGRADAIIHDAFFPRRRRRSSPRTPPPQPMYPPPMSYGPMGGFGFPGFGGGMGGGTNIIGFGFPGAQFQPQPQPAYPNPYGYSPLDAHANARRPRRHERSRRDYGYDSPRTPYASPASIGFSDRYGYRSRAAAATGQRTRSAPAGARSPLPEMFRTRAANATTPSAFSALAGRRNAPMPRPIVTNTSRMQGQRSAASPARYSGRYSLATPTSARPFLRTGTPSRRTFR